MVINISDKTALLSTLTMDNGYDTKIMYYLGDAEIMFKGEYLNGVRHGTSTFHDRKGRVIVSQEYVNGISDGVSKTYFVDGTVKEKCWSVNDDKHGEYIRYYKDGRIRKRCIFKDGNYWMDIQHELSEEEKIYYKLKYNMRFF